MKTPQKQPVEQPINPPSEGLQEKAQHIHDTFQKQIYSARSKAIEKCKAANDQAVADVEKIYGQYLEQVALLKANNRIRIEKIAQKYHAMELAHETSNNHLQELDNGVKERLSFHQKAGLVKQPRSKLDVSPVLDNTVTFDTQEAVIEQFLMTLDGLILPKLFLGNRPFIGVAVYAIAMIGILALIYGYRLLPNSTLYYIVPVILLLGIMLVGGGGGCLWHYTKRTLQDLYTQLLNALDSAYAILGKTRREAQQSQDLELKEANYAKDFTLRDLEQAKDKAYSHIRARRDAMLGSIGEELQKIEADIRKKRDEALHKAGLDDRINGNSGIQN